MVSTISAWRSFICSACAPVVPPELTLHIIRPPTGAWICLDAVTDLQSEGLGLTTAHLFDQRGQVARSAQSLFIARRAELPSLSA